MLALPPSDPRNWYRQEMIHVLDCPHANWWFLPWHRGYLLHFEEIYRQLSGDPGVRVALLGLDIGSARTRCSIR
jgi:tyrosinase